GALQNLAIDKQNLDSSMAANNNSRTPIVSPETVVFPKRPAERDDPNILICLVHKFGVLETPFYPGPDNTFRKFSYLPFIPEDGDYFDCQVQHEGMEKPVKTHWEPQLPAPVSEVAETVICALGLAVGIAGIAAGTVLILRGMKLGRARAAPGVL
ncbi:H-2 class II histocompatibility antigen, A-U alpha chain-like, partial [Malurus melanocephalus]|uniref:H-2 class II histocompatibility antigen, A-U alpha chain-like n=1 Tax=Malurus melanocephalus TaxID=175006 RepID=UPI002546DE90